LATLALQCIEAPLTPVAPTSDIQLSIPLINRTKYLSEFASQDSLLKLAPDGGYFYASTQSIKPLGIDSMKINPRGAFEQIFLGVFAVDPPAPLGDTLSYKEITGLDAPTTPAPSPSSIFSLPSIVTTPAVSFENATFETGTITLSVRNKFPVPIDFPDPIIVKNGKISFPVDTNEVARFTLAGRPLLPGEVSVVSSDLRNVTVQNSMRVPSFRLHTQASTGYVTFTQQSGIEYVVTLSNLTARSARATIPPQALLRTKDTVFTIDDSVSLQSATFKSGSFDIFFQNNIDADAKLSLSINELRDKSTGAPFTINSTFNGRGATRIPVNVATLKVQSSASAIGTRLTVSATLSSVESKAPRQVNSTDYLSVELQPRSAFVIQSITGRIKPTSLSVNSGAGGINLGEVADKFRGNITFDSVRIALKLWMTGGFPTDYNLRLVAMNRRVSPPRIDSLVVPPPQGSTQRRIYPAQGGVTQIVMDNSTGLNTFLSRFAPNLPDTFIVRGSAVMNPSDIFPTAQGIQTIYDTTKLYANVDLSFPLKLGLAGGEVIETANLNDDQRIEENVIRSFKSGTAYFNITNGLPVQLTLHSALLGYLKGGKRDTLLWIPTDGSRTIAAASVDQGGSVTSPKTTTFMVQLKQSEIERYNAADVFWFRLRVETTGGGTVPVKVRSTDFVTVRASTSIVYIMNQK
jgi:hypothetical protein